MIEGWEEYKKDYVDVITAWENTAKPIILSIKKLGKRFEVVLEYPRRTRLLRIFNKFDNAVKYAENWMRGYKNG